jgi:hypothetical protein
MMVIVGETRVVTESFWAAETVEVGELLTVGRIGFPGERDSSTIGVIFEKYNTFRHNLHGDPNCKDGHGWFIEKTTLLQHTNVVHQGTPDWEV